MEKLYQTDRSEYQEWANKFLFEYDRRIESKTLGGPVQYHDIGTGAEVLMSFAIPSWKSVLEDNIQKIVRKVRIVANGAQQSTNKILQHYQ